MLPLPPDTFSPLCPATVPPPAPRPAPRVTVCDVRHVWLSGKHVFIQASSRSQQAVAPVPWASSPILALLLPTVLVSKRQGKKHLEPTAEPKSILVQRNALRHHATDRLQAGWGTVASL